MNLQNKILVKSLPYFLCHSKNYLLLKKYSLPIQDKTFVYNPAWRVVEFWSGLNWFSDLPSCQSYNKRINRLVRKWIRRVVVHSD